jgi:hypothetical protein
MFSKIVTAAAALASVATLGAAPAQAHYHDRYDRHGYDHRGHHGGYYDRRCRNSGTGGAIIGGVAGGLLGNAVAGHGDKTLGTVLGAGGGALAGNAIARNGTHRC